LGEDGTVRDLSEKELNDDRKLVNRLPEAKGALLGGLPSCLLQIPEGIRVLELHCLYTTNVVEIASQLQSDGGNECVIIALA